MLAMKKSTDELHEELNTTFLELQEAHMTLPTLHRHPSEHNRQKLMELAELVRRYYRKLEQVNRRWEPHSEE
jgi:hypothetical protein